jgi:hypothetical protein
MPGQSSAIKRTTERKIYPAHGDPIRVVPLNVPQELIGDKTAPAIAPQLTYRNGALIKNVEIFTIFWGTGWQQAPASSLITQINEFFDYIVTSPLIDQLAEYNVPGQSIGHGSMAGTMSITAPPLRGSVSDAAIQHMLQIFYAVMPYPGCTGCTGSLDTFTALTSTSSHELCEAITDAIPGQGWYDDSNGEIGDICAWKTKTVGKYTVQLEWSNKANKCV